MGNSILYIVVLSGYDYITVMAYLEGENETEKRERLQNNSAKDKKKTNVIFT